MVPSLSSVSDRLLFFTMVPLVHSVWLMRSALQLRALTRLLSKHTLKANTRVERIRIVQPMINPPTINNSGRQQLSKKLQSVSCKSEGSLWAGGKDERIIVVDDWTVVEVSISVGVDAAGIV